MERIEAVVAQLLDGNLRPIRKGNGHGSCEA
jgi:hypothetical protein